MTLLLPGIEAAYLLTRHHFYETGFLFHALLRAVLAARRKLAALGQIKRMRHSAGNGVQTHVGGRIQTRDGNHQALGVGMGVFAIGEDGAGAKAVLDNPLVAQTTAWDKDQVVYLSPDSYLAFGGYYQWLQDLTTIKNAFTKAK